MSVKLPQVPPVPKDASPELARFLTAVKEIVETREGTRAQGVHRFITANEATKLDNNASSGRTGPFGTGTSGGASIKSPTNLTITPTIYYHVLTWTNTLDSHLSHVEIWWNTTNDVSTAQKLAVVTKPIVEFKNLAGTDYQDRYYWIRSVSYDGAYSPWLPTTSQGGMLIQGKETVGKIVEDMMDALNGGTPENYSDTTVYAVGDIVVYSGRRWKRRDYQIGDDDIDPTNAMWWDRVGILMEGEIDGVSTVGIDGNLAVDGSILARHVAADAIDGGHINAQAAITLDEGGKAIFGNDNIVIDTNPEGGGGQIVVSPDGGITGNDHVVLSGSNILFNYYDTDTLDHVEYSTLKRFEVGAADNGTTVLIPGIWKQQPMIVVSPNNLPVYLEQYSAQDQRIVMRAEDIELQPGSTTRWQFTATAALALSDGAIGTIVNDSTSYSGAAVNPPNQASDVVYPFSPDQIQEIFVVANTTKYFKNIYCSYSSEDMFYDKTTYLYSGYSKLRLHYKPYGGVYTYVDSPTYHTTNTASQYTFHLTDLPGLAEFYVESISMGGTPYRFSETHSTSSSCTAGNTYYMTNQLVSYESNLGASVQAIETGSLNWFAFGV